MVDFNNEATIGTPAVDVQRITVLQRRYDLFEVLEDHKKKTLSGVSFPFSYVQARLMTLFLELQGMLKRRWKDKGKEELKQAYDDLYNVCMGKKDSASEEDYIKAILKLNEFLDELNLTKLDTRQQYDSGDMEKENDVKGY